MHIYLSQLCSISPFQNAIKPESSSLAKPIWSLSLAMATTRTNLDFGNAISIVVAKAAADSLVWAERDYATP